MSDARVVKASYCNIRPVPTRGQVQLILELPLEEMASLIAKLGVPAMPGESKWVAVALLDPKAQLKDMLERSLEHETKPKDLSRSLAGKERYANADEMEQARVRSCRLAKNPRFQQWTGSRSEEAAATFIRRHCQVESRSEISTDPRAYTAYLGLEFDYGQYLGRVAEMRG